MSKTTALASSSSAVQTHLKNNTFSTLIYLLLWAMQLFMGSVCSRLESVASISPQLCLGGDQRCLWQWMNSVGATVLDTIKLVFSDC